ncbi:Nn.00g030300.m01.CDS01 [Neocucurbitaria sp. VM-36]
MSSVSSTFHIPFPRNFLAVNTPAKQSPKDVPASPESEQSTHGFLSNRPAFVPRHQSKSSSVSSIASVATSDAGTISPPSSPPTKAADSPVLGPKIFAPLAVNTKHALPPQTVKEMSVVEKSAFLSNKH